jgi:hypothetical protein
LATNAGAANQMSVIPDTATPAAPAGTPAPPPAPPRSVADIVKADPQGFAAATGQGSEGTTEPPAAPAAPADAKASGVAKGEPPVEKTAVVVPPTPAAKPPYTTEEFAAFDGNYHDRNFDWDRWPAELQDAKVFAKKVASGYGTRHAQLQAERAALEAERAKPASAQPAPATERVTSLDTPEAKTAALEKFLNPDTMFEGLNEILGTEQGKKMLSDLGYADPTERGVVSELVKERTISAAVAAIADGEGAPFPRYLADEQYRDEVNDFVRNDPFLRTKVDSRDVNDVTYAFAAANGVVTARRLAQLEGTLATREQALAAREAAILAGEATLKSQIESTNRQEPASPSVGGQSSGAIRKVGESTRDIVARHGPIPVA